MTVEPEVATGDNRDGFSGGLIVARPASERLRLIAGAELDDAVVSARELIVPLPDPGAALRTALQLRRWGASELAPPEQPAIGVAGHGHSRPAGADLSRARELAAAAAARQVLVDRSLFGAGVPPWLALRPPSRGSGADGLELCWAGPPPGEETELPLPGSLRSALDRPWAMLGREPELDSIAVAWSRAVAGSRGILLVAGEPGAGKSRLVAEAAAEIHRAGGLVLRGSGEDPSGTPYAPFAAALAHLDRHGDEQLLGELRASPFGTLIPGAGGDERRASGSLGDERGRLFSSAVEQFERLPGRSPVLLIIEDLHAGGLASLRLLEHLTRASPELRLLILATYRPTDLEPGSERAQVIAGLRSAPGAQHTELRGLGPTALRGIAAALGVAADAPGLELAAATAHRESGGNPLFACEVLRAMAQLDPAAPAGAPRSLRVLIASRAYGLGNPAHEHISAAAVAGRRFDPAVVAAALDVEPEALGESVRLAERAGLISIEPADGGCEFTHAIAARCLYEEVDPVSRGRIHRRIAAALEADGAADSPERAAELARHWQCAEPPDRRRAAAHCAVAGEAALAAYDHDAAAEWFERALELQASAGGGGDAAERCRLLIGLGTALRFSNQERSREILLEAGRLADSLDDVGRLAEAVLANHRGFVSLVGGFDRERGALLERAAERITENGPELALVLAQLALELTFSPQLARRRELALRALEVAREAGDQRVVSRVLIRYLIARWGPENAEERIAIAEESIAISSQLGEPLDLFHGLHWQAVAQIEVGRIGEAARTLREQERIAARIGDGTAQWLCACVRSIHLSLQGRLAAAEDAAQAAAELAQRSAQPDALPFYISQLASIRWQQARLGELAPLLAEVLEDHPGLPAFRALVTLAHVHAGEESRARAVLRIDAANDFSELPRDPVWIAGAVTYAHAIVELGDRQAATQIRAVIEPYRGLLASTSISLWGLVGHALGRLELLLGEHRQGRASLEAAIAGYDRLSAPIWRGQAELDLARGLGDSSLDERERERLIARAHAAGIAGKAGLLLAAADPPLGGAALERIAQLGLTGRQAEVLELVARGHSNAAIAGELGISVSTVKRHLENVFDRTGLRTRGALTAALLEEHPGDGGRQPAP